MPKKLLRRLTQKSSVSLSKHRRDGWLAQHLHDPNLLHFNRNSVSRACFAALFSSITLMVFPCHMITAAFLAVWLRANLPLSISLVWLVNPLTIPPLAYLALKLGLYVIPSTHNRDVRQLMHFDWEGRGTISDKVMTFWHLFERVWEPFMVGALSLGIVIGGFSYLLVQWSWRWHIIRSWNRRQKLRLQARLASEKA